MSQAKQQKLGKRETRDLDVEIGFLEGLVGKDPEYVEALQLLADDYTRRGRINDGLRVDHQLKRERGLGWGRCVGMGSTRPWIRLFTN